MIQSVNPSPLSANDCSQGTSLPRLGKLVNYCRTQTDPCISLVKLGKLFKRQYRIVDSDGRARLDVNRLDDSVAF